MTCVWIVSLFLSSCAPGQIFGPTMTFTPVTQTFTINVPANTLWFDTGIKIVKGQDVTIQATGNVKTRKNSDNDADGQTTFFCDDAPCHLPRAYYGALMGRLAGWIPFRIYTACYFTAPVSGALFLAFKDWSIEDNVGEFIVTVTVRQLAEYRLHNSVLC